MKLSKTIGRIATTLVATAMLASVAVVPAFADVPEPVPTYNGIGANGTQVGTSTDKEIHNLTFKKVLKMPEGVTTPAVSFDFTLKGATAGEDETVRGTGNGSSTSLEVYSGAGQSTGTATFTANQSTSEVEDGIVAAETVVNIPLDDLTFTDAGVYKYTLEESPLASTVADKDEYILSDDSTVYLYVERVNADTEDEDYIVTGAVMLKPGATYSSANKSDGKIVNTYLLDEDGDPKANELTVAKQVAGSLGNRSEDFEFTVKILYTYADGNEQNTGKTYKAVYEVWSESEGKFVVDSDKDPVVFTAQKVGPLNYRDWAAEQTFTVSHNERIHIYGISAKDQCQVKETNSGKGYDVTYKSNTKDAEGKVYQYTSSLTGVVGYLSDIKDGADAINMTFINTRNAVSPTGIVMNVAPYALLVVVAAAGCFVFMRKRRED